MSDITNDVVDSVVARAKEVATCVSNRVYFEPPQRPTFPFISFKFTSNDIEMKTGNGAEYQFTFSIYAQKRATSALAQCMFIAKALYEGFDKYSLPLSGGNAFCCHWDGLSAPFTEEDDRTIQYVTRYKILTTNN